MQYGVHVLRDLLDGSHNNKHITRAQQLLRWAIVPEQSGPKSEGEGCCALFREGDGSPSNTMSPVPRPTSVQSGILIIHPIIQVQPFGRTTRTLQTGQTEQTTVR